MVASGSASGLVQGIASPSAPRFPTFDVGPAVRRSFRANQVSMSAADAGASSGSGSATPAVAAAAGSAVGGAAVESSGGGHEPAMCVVDLQPTTVGYNQGIAAKSLLESAARVAGEPFYPGEPFYFWTFAACRRWLQSGDGCGLEYSRAVGCVCVRRRFLNSCEPSPPIKFDQPSPTGQIRPTVPHRSNLTNRPPPV
jgi:hypothetical protein